MNRFKFSKSGNGSALNNSQNEIHNPTIEFIEFDLSNNLHCVLHKDNRIPVVNLTIGYDVGSKDEEANKKGIAHLFEHLMFQGSKNVNKNGHFEHIINSGGNCNAFTMQDATVYYDFLPSSNLEKALWLESDRMNSLNLTEENLANQKSVVIEEKKQRVDNAPYGTFLVNIFKYLFKNTPYESFVIGEPDDINSFTVKEAVNFHKKYYSPGNSVLILSGDFEYKNAEEKIRKYFSDISKENGIVRKPVNIKELKNDIEIVHYDNVQLPMLSIAYQLPKAGSKEDYSMEFFSEIIANNKSSRLYKKLVYEKKLLKSIRIEKDMLKDAGLLLFQAFLNPGTDVEYIKNEIYNEINEICSKGISDDEFETIKNQIEFQNTAKYLKLINISITSTFNYLYFKDVSKINDEINKYLSVTKKDVTDFVSEFLLNKKKLTLLYLPMNHKKVK